jgi:hypothetical protein
VFHASSAIRTFWIAVSFVNGGSGGLGSIKSCGERIGYFGGGNPALIV